MDKNKKYAYSLLVLGIVLLTLSFIVSVVFDNTTFLGFMTSNQMVLEILYDGFSFGALICVASSIFLLIKNKESKANEKSI